MGLLGINRRRTELLGINRRHTELFGINRRRAELLGINRRRAELLGINRHHMGLLGINRRRTELLGINRRHTELFGINRRRAELLGINRRRAELLGINRHHTGLLGINRRHTELPGIIGAIRNYSTSFEITRRTDLSLDPWQIRAHFQHWNPLTNPTHGMDVIKSWKSLLQSDTSSGFTLKTQGNLADTARYEIDVRVSVIGNQSECDR